MPRYEIKDILPKLSELGVVHAVVRFPHMGDDFLFLVLIEVVNQQYVVWLYNAQVNGTSDGSYCTSPKFAYQKFMHRLESRVQMSFA